MCIGVTTLWLVVPAALVSISKTTTWSEFGQLGDVFGSVNSLFSGLAFAVLAWSMNRQQDQIDLQRQQLALQQEELGLQRQEMAASRAELANQVRAQYALVEATAAQITVASVQASIEATKLRIASSGVGTHWIDIVEQHAESLAKLSMSLMSKQGELTKLVNNQE